MALLRKFRLPDLTQDRYWQGDAADRPDEVEIPEDGAAATPSLRTLGSGAQQAVPGNMEGMLQSGKIWIGDPADTPAPGDIPADEPAGTPSMRTLGGGAQQAAPGTLVGDVTGLAGDVTALTGDLAAHEGLIASDAVLAHVKVGRNLEIDAAGVLDSIAPELEVVPRVELGDHLEIKYQHGGSGTGQGPVWNKDGDRMAFCLSGVSSNNVLVYAYNRATGAFSHVATHNLGAVAWCIDFNEAGDRIAVGHNRLASPWRNLTVYSFNKATNTLTPVASGYTGADNGLRDVRWNPDGDRVAAAHVTFGVRCSVWKFDRETNTISDRVDYNPGSDAVACDWNNDGDRLAIAFESSPYFRVLTYNKSTHSLGAGWALTLASRPEHKGLRWNWRCWDKPLYGRDEYIAVCGSALATNLLQIVRFIKATSSLSIAVTAPAAQRNRTVAWNRSKDTLAVGENREVQFYEFDALAHTLTPKQATPDIGSIYYVDFNPEGTLLGVGKAYTGTHTHRLHVWGASDTIVYEELECLIIDGVKYGLKPARLVTRKFRVPGALAVATNAGGAFIPPDTLQVIYVRCYAKGAPDGAAIIVDVNRNGVTIFTTQANRPTIPDGDNLGARSPAPNVDIIRSDDVITIDIDQVGSVDSGEDLTVELRCRQYS